MFHLITFQLWVQTYQETNVLQEEDIHSVKTDDMSYQQCTNDENLIV
jgi:hypothetical protein